jgi:hypothetical protein
MRSSYHRQSALGFDPQRTWQSLSTVGDVVGRLDKIRTVRQPKTHGEQALGRLSMAILRHATISIFLLAQASHRLRAESISVRPLVETPDTPTCAIGHVSYSLICHFALGRDDRKLTRVTWTEGKRALTTLTIEVMRRTHSLECREHYSRTS